MKPFPPGEGRDKLGESAYGALQEKWTPEAYLDRYFAIFIRSQRPGQ